MESNGLGVILLQILHVKLWTSSIDSLRSFYTYTLELPVQKDSKDEFTVKAGRCSLTFVNQVKADHVEENPFYHFAFDVPSTSIDKSIEWLKSKGIALNVLPNQQYKIYSNHWNATSIYFYDPAGNIVEFIARHDLNYSAANSFSSKDFIHISEIGLVVHDVPKIMDLLKENLNIETYKDYNERFAPVGDESGLFILSAYNRVWLGSNKPAKMFQTEITIEGSPPRSFSIAEYPYHIFIQ